MSDNDEFYKNSFSVGHKVSKFGGGIILKEYILNS